VEKAVREALIGEPAATGEDRIQEIVGEALRHDEAIKKVHEERAKITKSLEDLKRMRAEQVQKKMQALWADSGDSKAL
jgi:hypothetical protein